MLTTNGLTRRFWNKDKGEITAVDSVSLSIEQGEVFGLLGPNGAGKTTFLRMLATVLTPTSGTATINGYDLLTEQHQIKQSIGFLSGNTNLYGRLTPRELLQYFGELYGLSDRQIKKRCQKIFTMLEMDDFLGQRIESLSTGQTQKTSIARCLLHDPAIYIFDEPTLGLDIMTSRTIIDFIRQEADRGKTVLFSSHQMEQAEVLCDRIGLLHKGVLLDVDTLVNYKQKKARDNLRDIFFNYIEELEGEKDGV
jgi:sodium transport system ATP-binding protein